MSSRLTHHAWVLTICYKLLARYCVDLLIIRLPIKPSNILLKHHVAGVSHEQARRAGGRRVHCPGAQGGPGFRIVRFRMPNSSAQRQMVLSELVQRFVAFS